MPLFPRRNAPEPVGAEAERPTRVLFLDDDSLRATAFLAGCPHAVWVKTAADCIARLEETWDEVHLDHDLGGEQFVDPNREDCGMEVVRWICLTPRPHLKPTRFLIHSHNPFAATEMGIQMTVSGFKCEVRPFGATATASADEGPDLGPDPGIPRSRWEKLRAWVRRRLGWQDEIDPAFYEYLAQCPGPDDPAPERPDFDWSLPAARARDESRDAAGGPPV